ncbi:MAG: addA [Bacilli bacterium]|nr:addA [Bacilli bacterium]
MSSEMLKPDHWTNEQWQAITQQGQNLLVAAAAGSGKTSVLVERIIRLITDRAKQVQVDQLLVVTFTNAAAAEMRHRLGEALQKALQADPGSSHLRRQLALLPRASITTLHSFCLGLLRQYYYLVDLDPNFRIADALEAELLRQDVLDELLEEWYELDNEFKALADCLVEGQDDEALKNTLFRLYNFSRSHHDPIGWLQQSANSFLLGEGAQLQDLPWLKSVTTAIRLELTGLVDMLTEAIQLADTAIGPAAYLPLLQQERETMLAASRAGQSWQQLESVMQADPFGRLPAVKDADAELKAQVQALRNQVKERFRRLQADYFFQSEAAYLDDLRLIAPQMKTLVRAVEEFDQAYQQAKQSRLIVDFNDLEHLALRLLRDASSPEAIIPSEIARQLAGQFAQTLVDEYQDINLVQETILQLVSRVAESDVHGNRFMVGDVKQSIYRFRLAEPNLFLAKYQGYSHTDAKTAATRPEDDPIGAESGLRIDLAANFRSRQEVVHAVNDIFRQIMTEGIGEIPYDASAELVPRASYPEIDTEMYLPEVYLINRSTPDLESDEVASEAADFESPPEENFVSERDLHAENQEHGEAAQSQPEASSPQLEARLIAGRIQGWMQPGQGVQLQVFDKQVKQMRLLEYRDIVILLRATAGWAPLMMDEFQAAGIPVYLEQSDGFFQATEIGVMLSLLSVIDNPLQDIPLAAALRSPIVGLNEEQLAAIRVRFPRGPFFQAVISYAREALEEKESWQAQLGRFVRQLGDWRTRARQGSLAELITHIYRQTGYIDYVAALENGSKRQANLYALCERARQYEASAYRGLFRFLRFVERLQQQGRDLGEARTMGETENVVRIMTIHKSKGLEFPVVFVAGLGKQFNTLDLTRNLLLHKELGFGPQVIDPLLRLRYPSIAYLGIKQQLKREMLAEEMRVLYVALTRAREKLVLTCTLKDLDKSSSNWMKQSAAGSSRTDQELLQAKTFMDWIGPALFNRSEADPSPWRMHTWQAKELSRDQAEKSMNDAIWEQILQRKQVEHEPGNADWLNLIDYNLTWKYPFIAHTQIAAKWSVSDLKRLGALADADETDALSEVLEAPGQPAARSKITRKPRFLAEGTGAGNENRKQLTAAEIGTITHTVMQQLDLDGLMDAADIRRQIEAMVIGQYLTASQAEQVNVEQVAAFFASAVGKLVKQAVKVHRELPFTCALPAREILPAAAQEDQRVIVQGVIDLVAELPDGRIVLVDFKTDAIYGQVQSETLIELTDRYRLQLTLYRQAIEQIWHCKVHETYLYYFSKDLAILL